MARFETEVIPERTFEFGGGAMVSERTRSVHRSDLVQVGEGTLHEQCR